MRLLILSTVEADITAILKSFERPTTRGRPTVETDITATLKVLNDQLHAGGHQAEIEVLHEVPDKT